MGCKMKLTEYKKVRYLNSTNGNNIEIRVVSVEGKDNMFTFDVESDDVVIKQEIMQSLYSLKLNEYFYFKIAEIAEKYNMVKCYDDSATTQILTPMQKDIEMLEACFKL